MKYIKKIFEVSNNVKILSIDGSRVQLINPDGKEVTVEFEEDGQWSDWVDPPYVKEVSISGDDGKYQYSMGASTDEHGHHFEINTEDIEWETLADVRAREERMQKRHADHMAKVEKERKEEEARVNKEISDLGITRFEYEVRVLLNSYKEPASDSNYVIVETESIDDEGFSFSHYWKIRDPEGDLESTFNTFSDLGLEDTLISYFEDIPKRSRNRIVRVVSAESNESIHKDIKLRDLKKYIDRFPNGVSLDPLFNLLHRHGDAI